MSDPARAETADSAPREETSSCGKPVPSRLTCALENAAEKVVWRVMEAYLGDKPEEMGLGYKFLNALLGSLAFFSFALPLVQARALRSMSELRSISEARGMSDLDAEIVYQTTGPLFMDPVFLLVVYSAISMILATLIAVGITHGGPLRLFFLGVTVPALVVYIVNSALS